MKIKIPLLIIIFFCLLLSYNLSANEGLAKWQVYKSTHFVIHYNNSPEDFIVKLSEKAEDYYNRIAEDLGFIRYDFWLWDNRAQIYIYDNADEYQKATGLPGWSSGAAIPQKKVINSFLDQKNFLEIILPHELGHIIFREFVGFDNYAVPLWLEEGVASYQEKTRHYSLKPIMKKSLEDGSFMNIEVLSNLKLLSAQDRKIVELFYLESVSIVDYLIKEFSRDNFVTFCQALRDKKDIDRALASAFPFSNTRELDDAWQKYLKK